MTTFYPAAARRIMSLAPKPSRRPFHPSGEDQLWFSAYCLGRDGIDCDPPQRLTADEVAAWLHGYGSGLERRDEDLEAAFHRELDRIEMAARDRAELNAEGGGL